jgi:hypothetical protein
VCQVSFYISSLVGQMFFDQKLWRASHRFSRQIKKV